MFGRGLGDTYVVFVLPLERDYGWTRSQLTSVYSIYLLMHGFTSPLDSPTCGSSTSLSAAWSASA